MKKFLEKIRGYVRDEEEGRLVLNTKIMKVLMDWLTNHILISDKKYSSLKVKNGGSSLPR